MTKMWIKITDDGEQTTLEKSEPLTFGESLGLLELGKLLVFKQALDPLDAQKKKPRNKTSVAKTKEKKDVETDARD